MKKVIREGIISEITVTQKEGITHTKFLLVDGKKPFPPQNFKLAQHWCARGLLDEETEAFIRKLDPETPMMFR